MNKFIRQLVFSGVLLGGLLPVLAQAAPRDATGSNKMVAKLQSMVKDMTTERDQLKAEKDKLASEIDQIKKEKTDAVSDKERVSGELAAQKSSIAEVKSRLEQTHAKLLEVIEKYKVLNQEKANLAAAHAELQNAQRTTEAELQGCEGKNLKLFEAAKKMLDGYDKQGVMEALFKSEPVFGFKSVEMESLAQEYEDKLRKQTYRRGEVAKSHDAAPESGNVQEVGKPN
ncbi:hypothetical protein [Methylomicrobium lacus]|uniref:hypothetical protein n=1 Tax=Methylomicrobium lacus TaxID=136992 RepID=UPI0035A8E916